MAIELRTARLKLRGWRQSDLAPYAALNADPQVRRFFSPSILTPAQSNAQAGRLQAHIEKYGFGFWAVETIADGAFIGFVGLQHVTSDLPFAPAVEIGWRLARAQWGAGHATEAATAALAHGFGPLALREIVSYAVADNWPSRRVMERIGMQRDPGGDFDEPGLAADHPLARQVLYRRSDVV